MENIKVRFPPSPTGYCHVGTARMALINFLFAKKNGGTIVFRSEDTDRERSTKEYEDDITDSLKWLGLSWDEFCRQSERLPSHIAAIQKLLAEDKAYLSEEESKREPGKRVTVVRLRNPGKTISFSDVIRGDISFNTAELGDFVIARGIGDPLYHLAVVIDDAEMAITHVIRGEEHISNTPRQILIQEALGYTRPIYAHYPLFLGADKAKLSKRKGDVAVRDFRSDGFLPPAMINFIGTLGWTPPSGRELLSLEEMIAEFNLADLHQSGAVFDMEKLRWFNRQYIERMNDEEFATYALTPLTEGVRARVESPDPSRLVALLPLVRERISVVGDLQEELQNGEFDFYFKSPNLDPKLIPEKKSTRSDAVRHLSHVQQVLSAFDEASWTSASIKSALWDYASAEGRGAVLWPLRYSLSGKERSPDPFTIASIIGKEESLRRIQAALQQLETV